jgi:hypothetical protein
MINGKKVTDYLFQPTSNAGHITHTEYTAYPGTAFLKFCLEAKDSIEFCKQHFPKHPGNNRPTIESNIKIQHIVNSTLALIMGHFETYQKYLFAGTFERTIYFDRFDSAKFFKNISDKGTFELSLLHLLGYREEPMTAGILLADHIGAWQSPEKVNTYFNAFEFATQLFSNDDCDDLKTIWQLRHSIVHTAATITRTDAQKASDLSKIPGRNIVFTNKFIYEFVKRLHSLVYNANKRISKAVEARLKKGVSLSDKAQILSFYEVNSKNGLWLK